ncbi:GNAT family N-acetyltransferase [Limobrevibacterium gyesilva]|uniref:GNAT family N-acetyltransferase n=1 Tax=Limobrevibacterium gyesilva TaxID=2991712 RepID=A0AA41YR66_9PROT|nr:GNAT family N-acetyltransferase [Limobrevibacterium gyesilva]MCW3477067.1 GNAT family N-acetyltransferase [Limobrevibacterium gyesilva]
MQPTFETSRLLIRPRTLADTDDCLAMDRDPEVTRFVRGPWSDATAHRAFVEERTRGPYPKGLGYWTVCRRDQAASFVGWVLLIPADGVGPEIEIGWRLQRSAWGQGFATEAARPVLQYAFATLKLPEVVAEIDPDNAGSLRVAEKLGLTEGAMIQHEGKRALRCMLKAEEAGVASSAP